MKIFQVNKLHLINIQFRKIFQRSTIDFNDLIDLIFLRIIIIDFNFDLNKEFVKTMTENIEPVSNPKEI